MSIDIDWSLLSPPPLHSPLSPQPSSAPAPSSAHPPGSLSLAATLVNLLNTHLSSPSLPRPSFIGPITILDFHFGSTGPDVELKDVRDVWRAFEEDQDSPMSTPLEDELEGESDLRQVERDVYPASASAYPRPRTGPGLGVASTLDDEPYEMIQPNMRLQDLVERQRELEHEDEGAEVMSVLGGLSASVAGAGVPRAPSVFSIGSPSIAHVGIGASIARSRSASHDFGAINPGTGMNMGMGAAPFSPSLSFRPPSTYDGLAPTPLPLHPQVFPSTDPTPPPSPPARPRDVPGHSPSAPGGRSSSLPSLQLHLRYHHRSDLCLTLQTSLQVNYPSIGFMALPLKLSIVGMTFRAEVVLAFDAERSRVHLCVVDDDHDEGEDGAEGTGAAGKPVHVPVPIGQRVLPSLTMETEIGDKDTHVLRNVGKVERFIGDVVRKTLVDELVWPNFHTIQL